MSERDVRRLPQWAQQEIAKLEHNVAFWKEKATAGPENSNTFIRNLLDDSTPLGKSPTIAFAWGPNHYENIQVRLEGDHLDVMGGESLIIRPRSSNYLWIARERR